TPTLSDDLFQRPDHGRVVPRARQLPKLPDRLFGCLHGWTEDTGLGDSVEGVAGVDDARSDRDCLADQSVVVTRTIPALVMAPDNRRDVPLLRLLSQAQSSLDGTLTDA